MKRSLLLILFATAMSESFSAQSFKIMIGSQDVTGTTIQVYGAPGSSYTGNFNVHNTSANNISTRARKEEITISGSGASASICFGGSCFGPATYQTPCKNDSAGKSAVFTADFTFDGTNTNASTVRYCMSSCTTPSDSAFLIIVYNPSAAGIVNPLMNFSVSEPFPNPASSTVNFDYKLSNGGNNLNLMVYNLLGSLVKNVDLSETTGSVKLDVAGMDAGMYFYSFMMDGKTLTSKKFIVKH